MERAEIQEKIKEVVESMASAKLDSFDQEIFKSGFLDSLNVLHVIVFIEKTFDLKIETFDLTIDSLATVNLITDFISKKLREKK